MIVFLLVTFGGFAGFILYALFAGFTEQGDTIEDAAYTFFVWFIVLPIAFTLLCYIL